MPPGIELAFIHIIIIILVYHEYLVDKSINIYDSFDTPESVLEHLEILPSLIFMILCPNVNLPVEILLHVLQRKLVSVHKGHPLRPVGTIFSPSRGQEECYIAHDAILGYLVCIQNVVMVQVDCLENSINLSS